MEKYPMIKIKDGKKYFYRFTLNQRIQHLILAVSVVILVLTGMPLKFSETRWAQFLAPYLGGFETAGFLHRLAAVITFIWVVAVFALAGGVLQIVQAFRQRSAEA